MPTPVFIAVLNYRTGSLLYCGTSFGAAANQLVPGTVFGKGSTEKSAVDHAMRRIAEQVPAIS